jgi:hypothetical protein
LPTGTGLTLHNPKDSVRVGGRAKLFWGVRAESAALVRAVRRVVGVLDAATAEVGSGGSGSGKEDGCDDKQGEKERESTTTEMWGGAEVTISAGRRFDIDTLLARELLLSSEGHGGAGTGGTTVVVCGPAAMADEVRVAVARLGRRGAVVRLIEESFSW